MNLPYSREDEIRLAAAAADQEMSVEEFVFSAIERALQPIEDRRRSAMRDVVERAECP